MITDKEILDRVEFLQKDAHDFISSIRNKSRGQIIPEAVMDIWIFKKLAEMQLAIEKGLPFKTNAV